MQAVRRNKSGLKKYRQNWENNNKKQKQKQQQQKTTTIHRYKSETKRQSERKFKDECNTHDKDLRHFLLLRYGAVVFDRQDDGVWGGNEGTFVDRLHHRLWETHQGENILNHLHANLQTVPLLAIS